MLGTKEELGRVAFGKMYAVCMSEILKAGNQIIDYYHLPKMAEMWSKSVYIYLWY